MSDRPECAVPLCVVPRQHQSDCNERCDGCIPGLAMAGLRVCQHHRDQIARGFDRLPRLYAELAGCLAPYRSPQAPRSEGGRTTNTADDEAEAEELAEEAAASKALTETGLAWMRGTPASRLRQAPAALSPAVYESRREIERKFWDWCAYVTAGREREHREDCARRGVKTDRVFTMPAGDVPAMGRYLERYTDWLCKDRLAAPAIGARLKELRDEARHMINRTRASGLLLGACPVTEPTLTIDDDGRAHRGQTEPCGGAIRFDQEEQRACRELGIAYQVTCPRCGTGNSWLGWHRQIVGDVEVPRFMSAVEVAGFLSDLLALELAAANRKITSSTIGKWKYDETQEPGTGITATACHPKTKRDLFDRTVVEAFARNRLKLNPESRTA